MDETRNPDTRPLRRLLVDLPRRYKGDPRWSHGRCQVLVLRSEWTVH